MSQSNLDVDGAGVADGMRIVDDTRIVGDTRVIDDVIGAYLQLRLRPGEGYSCPLTAPLSPDRDGNGFPKCSTGEEIHEIRFVKEGDECLVQFILESNDIVSACGPCEESSCLSGVFRSFGCVPRYTGIKGKWVHVSTHVADQDRIRPLIDELQAIVETVVIDRLIVSESGDCEDLVLFDRSTLTEKQQEAVELAVETGYYDRNDDVTLAEVADELGIGQSALSERLRSAQSKLANDLF